MIFDAKFKPWAVCSTDAHRLAFAGCFLDKKAGALIATDGKRLATFPVRDTEDDEEGIIPPEALKAAIQLAKQVRSGALPPCLTVKGGTVTARDGRAWPTIKAQYPEWRQVTLPDGFEAAHGAEGKRTARIILDPELLEGLCAALRGKSSAGALLEFLIDEVGDACTGPVPIVVTTAGQRAYLMPMRMGAREVKKASDVKPV